MNHTDLTVMDIEEHRQIGVMDITDQTQNTLHLTLEDILSHTQQNLLISDGKAQLAIQGDTSDVVELKISDLSAHEWTDAGHTTAGGVTYEVYQHAGSDVELLVQQGVELHQVA
jgi:ABC-type uncharacterized transport system permease subunit